MQVFDFYPMGAAGGSCIITKDYTVGDGRKIISLDIDIDSLPANGLICLSEEGVRQLNTALDWVADEKGQERIVALTEQVAGLETANAALVAALSGISVSQDLLVPLAEAEEVKHNGTAADDAVALADEDAAAEADEKPTGAYEDRTKAQLLDRATELDITGRHDMSKPELIKALREDH